MRFLFSNYMIAFYILAAVLIWILSGVLGGNDDNELVEGNEVSVETNNTCLLYTSPSPRDS